ncbi:hypothetical protein BC936DRAFT_143210, partial [Jimgerdemannia flammicorona]
NKLHYSTIFSNIPPKKITLTDAQKYALCTRLKNNEVSELMKQHRSVTVPEVELILKEFVLNYQH